MSSNLDPQIFRDAARMINLGVHMCCCDALDEALCDYNRNTENKMSWGDVYGFFAGLFKPELAFLFWWYEFEQEPRIIALLLCADILESERTNGKA